MNSRYKELLPSLKLHGVIKMLLSVNWVCIILSVCKKQKRKEVPINHNIWRATGLCGLESNALFGGASG